MEREVVIGLAFAALGFIFMGGMVAAAVRRNRRG